VLHVTRIGVSLLGFCSYIDFTPYHLYILYTSPNNRTFVASLAVLLLFYDYT
jgi:hypothetical protein